MDMEEWKRTYSNEDTQKVALPYFWKHFDPNTMSIWKCKYLYDSDLSMPFMSENLIQSTMLLSVCASQRSLDVAK